MKIHKLEDGDIIKILPMIDKNNKISWIKQYDCVGLNTKTFISDTKGYLRRISLMQSNSVLPITTRYAMNIYIDGEIRILNVGRKLFQIITDNKKLWDIKGNHHIFVVKKDISAGNGHVFPSYDKTYVLEKDWTPPVSDINSEEEWLSYIKSNQPDFDTHIEKNNIFNHKQLLIDYLGKDMLSELISDDRQKKLEGLGV